MARMVSDRQSVGPQLLEMTTLENEGKQRLAFLCPSRGLIGFRPAFATLTRGAGLMHRAFHEYGPFRGHMDRVRKGVLISMAGVLLAAVSALCCGCCCILTPGAHSEVDPSVVDAVLFAAPARLAKVQSHRDGHMRFAQMVG